MMTKRVSRLMCLVAAGFAGVVSLPAPASAQQITGTTFDEIVPPGGNYDTAAFRLWYPNDVKAVQGIVLLVPGSNSDGRGSVDNPVWQAFATRHQLALVGCYLTDRPHPQGFIEEYVNVSKGSGEALLHALTAFAEHAKHPELAAAPLLLWGTSAGGEFDYEFTAWKPERVIAFVVNKGGIYYSALVPPAARAVPGVLFTGEKDLEQRKETITGLFAVNRRAGALWALAEEPGIAHDLGESRDLALLFFADVLASRVEVGTHTTLKALTEASGFLGDGHAKTIQAAGGASIAEDHPMMVWLPTERVARAWRAVVTGTPIDSSAH